jgi:hypothetical protein
LPIGINLEFTIGDQSMMKRNAHKVFKMLLPVSILGLGFALMMLFQRPISAQITPQIIPRIDMIKPQQANISPAYRLTISRPQDIVYVTCPGGHAPKLNYLRNVEAIQCERPQSN